MYAIGWRKIQITILKLAYSLGEPKTVKLFTTMEGKNIYSVVLSCKMGTQLLMVAMICCFTILQGGNFSGKTYIDIYIYISRWLETTITCVA